MTTHHTDELAAQNQAVPVPAGELARLREDAARYRWLRNRANVASHHRPIVSAGTPDDILIDSSLDAEVDAAMRDEP